PALRRSGGASSLRRRSRSEDADPMVGLLLGLFREVLRSDKAPPVPLLKALFATLAHAGRFGEPLWACLRVMAEVAGDHDEVLAEVLASYLERRAGRPAGGGRGLTTEGRRAGGSDGHLIGREARTR